MENQCQTCPFRLTIVICICAPYLVGGPTGATHYSPNNKLQGSVFVIFKCGKFSAGSSECEQPCDAESNLLTCSSASISCLPWDSKTYLREEKSSPDMIIDVKWILSQICCDWVGTNHL